MSRRWRRHARWRAGTLFQAITVSAGLLGGARHSVAQTTDPLAPVAFLAGHAWLGEGTWPDGSELRVEVRYFWGPTKRLLHFETFDLVAGERRLLYEGIIVFDPTRSRIVQWNIKPTGDMDVSQVSRADTTGYELVGVHTRSIITRAGVDAFHWELLVRKNDSWSTILDAVYRRLP